MVKGLLAAAKLHIPFSGGLSSYSTFLMVLSAYDRCIALEAKRIAGKKKLVARNSVINPSEYGGGGVGSKVTNISLINPQIGEIEEESENQQGLIIDEGDYMHSENDKLGLMKGQGQDSPYSTAAAAITEGDVFLHFLQLFSSGMGLNPLVQGMGKK